MSEFIDHRSYIYGHGLVSQNCFAKQYSNETGLGVTLVETGTFVKVHSIRDDDVLFCIVRDDMQEENNQMVCRKADIINVPENLWGPLFTVKKSLRLSLVKDSKVAESIGNLAVGHTVRVLGPDNTPICTAKLTFRNSISRLGVGIYFGLQILNPKENLEMIIEKVSLLRPGTKGFPRGCDIIVTVDRLSPNNCNWNQEKETFHYDKECKKELVKNFFDEPDANIQSFKSIITHNLKNKHSNNSKKEKAVCCSDSDINLTHSYLKKVSNCDIPLKVGDEVIYLNGDTPEKGFVRWIGVIENSVKVGVEFENPIGNGTGVTDTSLGELFRAKSQHALFVSPMALIKLSDYFMNPSKDAIHLNSSCCSSKSSSNSSSSSNNNNVITNNNNENNQDSASTNYKNSICSNYLKAHLSINNRNNSNSGNNNNNNNNNNTSNNFNNNSHCSINRNNNDVYCRPNEICYGEERNAEDSYKRVRKGSSSHQCSKHAERCLETGDCLLGRNKEEIFEEKDSTKRCQLADGAFESEYEGSSKSFDFAEANERKLSYQRNCNSVDNCFIQEKNYYLTLQNPKSVSRFDRPSHDQYDLAGPKQEKSNRSHLCTIKKVHKSFDGGDDDFNFCDSNIDKNAANFLEKEQSALAQNRNAKSEPGADALYDVPPRAVRYVSVPERFSPGSGTSRLNHSRLFPQLQGPSPTFNQQHELFVSTRKDTWGSQHSEHSSSDEYLADHCGPSRPSPEDLGRGSVVELNYKGEAHFGVIRWIGTFPSSREGASSRLIAGIEMEEEYPEFTDGTFKNKRYFQCNPKKALFVPLSKCRKDSRFLEETQKQSLPSKINYGQIDCPIVEGTIPPINRKGEIELICGKNKGIQGHHNSCYLDATLFSMFAFTSVFDSLLYRPPTKNDIPEYSEVQRVLREEIVNPLRKNLYVRADRVMKLRTLLEKLSSVSGLTSEEKDPEEFLNSLLAQILKAEPFLKLSSGQEAFHYQLFVEKDERLVLPTVQQLFEQSFVTSDIKLKQVPSCLIIQMPRFGKSFKMYSKILPPQLLDVTDIIENSPRQCTVCGKLAEFECKDCFGQQGIGNGLESISFCKTCLETAHNHHCRSRHNSRALTVPMEFCELQEHCIIPRLYMELFAVVCIETSHYVAFVKCGSGSDAPWCFFDSMADRKGEQNGYNIPEMVPCPDLPYWLSEEGAKMLNEMRDERQLTDHAKRLFSDAYMCMYQSPDLMMYR